MNKEIVKNTADTDESIVTDTAVETVTAAEVTKSKRGRKPKAKADAIAETTEVTETTEVAETAEVAETTEATDTAPEADKVKTSQRGKPTMTWTARGFLFNGEAIQLIGAPQFVVFELDETAKTLIIKDAGETKPRFSFATSEKRSKTAFITANKFREAIATLLGKQPEQGGMHFPVTADESGRVGIVDLST